MGNKSTNDKPGDDINAIKSPPGTPDKPDKPVKIGAGLATGIAPKNEDLPVKVCCQKFFFQTSQGNIEGELLPRGK